MKDSTCSTDKKSELRCDGAKFVTVGACTGPDGCTVSPSNDGYVLSCDDHVAAANAPCLEDGRFACTPDGKTMLRCTRGHFVLASTCKGPGACKVTKNAASATITVACDGNISDVGDPCEPDHTACAPDEKTLLGCKDGAFAAKKRCPNGCVPVQDGLECR